VVERCGVGDACRAVVVSCDAGDAAAAADPRFAGDGLVVVVVGEVGVG
jgi:hypothetical protein